VSASRPGRSLPPGKTRYPLYRRLGGPQGQSGQVQKISPPPGFDPRTVQPVASRYTDWATRPTEHLYRCFKWLLPNMRFGILSLSILLPWWNCLLPFTLTLNLLMWRIGWTNNASKQQVGFNSAFKGLTLIMYNLRLISIRIMKANEMHYFSNLFDKVLCMFWTSPLSIIRSISMLYTCNRYLSC
jgi:hypothetical protein